MTAEPKREETRLGWRRQERLDALVWEQRMTTEPNAGMDDPGPITLTRSALCLPEERGVVRRQEASYRSGQPIVSELVKAGQGVSEDSARAMG